MTSNFGMLAGAANTVTAPVDALTMIDPAVAIPGWVQRAAYNTKDGTCIAANVTEMKLRPIDYCSSQDWGSTRMRCDGSDLLQDNWDGAYGSCDNDGLNEEGESIFPECGNGLGDFEVAELATCRFSSATTGQVWTAGSSDEPECTIIDLGSQDSIYDCWAACDTDKTNGGTCDRVTYYSDTKQCNGVDSECTDGDSADDTVIATTDGSDEYWMSGCSGTALPGGVVKFYSTQDGSNMSTATCVPEKDSIQLDEKFFVFDKCEKVSDGSYATYCVDDKVIHSSFGTVDCTGAPLTSWELTNTCTVNNDGNRSFTAHWWGKCGGEATIEDDAAAFGTSATCVEPAGVDPACTCDSGVGIVDGVWGDNTCGKIVAEHGCAEVKNHFVNGAPEDKPQWESACCGESSASVAATQFALVSALAAVFLRKLF